MLDLFKSIFGAPGVELNAEDLRNGTIVDVRTAGEYQNGHVAGSLNIPLQLLDRKLLKLRQLDAPIIACCASGSRSGMAARQLNELGIETINGGSWHNVDRQVKQLV
ncbi:rhodanese-like domain-containing protein [Neolewinella aurantiaca]|uniref:Rhodanese-like domain-containing protein n=1 Tax=Neolewinella aurantiaca TaxID=2602767 RepID=A0A5C7F7I6_9BACT|nr:rhodanese-like domain-containing protein [Neolewinella aurantiaca]TXF86652.1 rhodanese-like domain-containing protein [Neolewinella aurantiaca]